MTIKTHPYKIYGMQQSSSQREVHKNTGLPQKTREISNKQPNLPPKVSLKRRTNKT